MLDLKNKRLMLTKHVGSKKHTFAPFMKQRRQRKDISGAVRKMRLQVRTEGCMKVISSFQMTTWVAGRRIVSVLCVLQFIFLMKKSKLHLLLKRAFQPAAILEWFDSPHSEVRTVFRQLLTRCNRDAR